MELLLIPVLLVAGAALFHLGVNGVPSFAQPVADLTSALTLKSVRYAEPRPLRIAPHAAPPKERPLPQERPMATQETTLQMTDILLADLLTEMVQFREALTALQQRVDALTPAQPELAEVAEPRRRTRRSA